MKKSDYFRLAIARKYYRDRRWLLRVLSLPKVAEDNLELPHILVDGGVGFKDGEAFVTLEDATIDKPIFGHNEKVTFSNGDLPNIKVSEVTTSYRIALLNAIILTDTFGDIFEYHNDKFSGKFLNKLMEDAIRSDVITTKQYKQANKAMGFITFMSDLAVPTSSEKVIRSSKRAIQVRDELVKKYKDQLSDPTVVAMIDKEIVKVLREELEGDDAEGFFIKGKQINKVRKMTHGMVGGVARLDDPTKVDTITRSLGEGLRPEDMAAVINQVRVGSYDRGKDTALGGEATNFSTRAYQNLKIVEGDCGTKVGLPTSITFENHTEFVGRYLTAAPRKPLEISDLKGMIGREVFMRDPVGCLAGNGNYCQTCLGKNIAEGKVGLGPQLNTVTSVFLSISLASFHGKELVTEEFDIVQAIS